MEKEIIKYEEIEIILKDDNFWINIQNISRLYNLSIHDIYALLEKVY